MFLDRQACRRDRRSEVRGEEGMACQFHQVRVQAAGAVGSGEVLEFEHVCGISAEVSAAQELGHCVFVYY